MKRYSIILLLTGIGLIVGSCVPLAQTLWSVESGPERRLDLAPGEAAALAIERDLAAVPVLVVVRHPGAGTGSVPVTFSIKGPDGGTLVTETREAAFAAGGDVDPTLARLSFPVLKLPAGRWRVRLDSPVGADVIRGAELRLLNPSPGVMPALMTTLVLAILGWLTASLGALQWIRLEAARPGAVAATGGGRQIVRLWAAGCHLSALLGYLLPFGHLLGPLAIWLSKRHEIAAIEETGRGVLNFQLSITVYVLAALLLSFFLIGIAVLFVLVVFHFTMVLYAALRAQRGLDVSYPLTIRFI